MEDVAVSEKPRAKRAPKQDYGFKPTAVITLSGKETKYRGARGDWFAKVRGFEGQTVATYMAAYKNDEESPRGWLRFFVQDGAVNLIDAS